MGEISLPQGGSILKLGQKDAMPVIHRVCLGKIGVGAGVRPAVNSGEVSIQVDGRYPKEPPGPLSLS